MNPRLVLNLARPVIRHTGKGTQHYSHLEAANQEATFWQSRATRTGKSAPFPRLTNIPALARDIRRSWYEAGETPQEVTPFAARRGI